MSEANFIRVMYKTLKKYMSTEGHVISDFRWNLKLKRYGLGMHVRFYFMLH